VNKHIDRPLSFYDSRKFRRLRFDPCIAQRTFYNNLIARLVLRNEVKPKQQGRRKNKDIKKLQWIIRNGKATNQQLQQYLDMMENTRDEQKLGQQQEQKLSQGEWLKVRIRRKAERKRLQCKNKVLRQTREQ